MTRSTRQRRTLVLLSALIALTSLTTAPPASAATSATAACTAGVKFTDPYRVASNNTVRVGYRLSTTCGGKASIGFWTEGPVRNAWEDYWEFQPGGGSFGKNYVIGKCRTGTYEALIQVVYAAADGTSVEIRRNSARVRISC